MKPQDQRFQSLRRNRQPYAVFAIPVALLSVSAAYVGINRHETALVVAAGAVWIGFLPMWAIMYRYAISWTDSEVRMRAFGVPTAIIRYSDIQQIKYERSGVRQLFGLSRPSPRISIYGHAETGISVVIDISLRHFYLKDVQEILGRIGSTRKDLSMPKLR
jgi:hypothetical protein